MPHVGSARDVPAPPSARDIRVHRRVSAIAQERAPSLVGQTE